MARLELADFGGFFEALWGQEPFPWQRRLADQVCESGWPAFIDLPTASGKTACLDVAVFALALQASRKPEERTIGRRIFFVVNRRVIVDEAHERAIELARKLNDAKTCSVLHEVAQALREVSGDPEAPALDVAILRGGIVRDNRWARSITQPAIITSTIDQVGSRLLFRGYGVSDAAKPLHAALIAHDSLLLLDEAHISQPFVETLDAIKRYRGEQWADNPIRTPFDFVQMTATPAESSGAVFQLDDADREDPVLQVRHGTVKPVELKEATKAKGKNALEELAKELAERAVELLHDERRNIAIVVNRIATARMVAQQLSEMLRKAMKSESEVLLAIGRMRPIDRDALTKTIQARVGKSPDTEMGAIPMFVVATQCLEVGADFDFDAMVSECASLDALRQRFGRLNRRGRKIDAHGVIVVRADQREDADDPIYGTALTSTWGWLKSVAPGDNAVIDFSVHALNCLLDGVDVSKLFAPRVNAPVIFPAYVDAWAQTYPIPAPDPDVSLFLHGPQRGEPDVQVCWRDDLLSENTKEWVQIVSLCPPSSPECMTVPIGLVRRWLAAQDVEDEDRSDLLDGKAPEPPKGEGRKVRTGVLWRGPDKSILLISPTDLRPGDTLVLPVSAGGWEVFGHIPEDAPKDVAEEAYRQSSGRTLLRLRPNQMKHWPDVEPVAELRDWLSNPEVDLKISDLRKLLCAVADAIADSDKALAEAIRTLGQGKYGLEFERYPDQQGVILRTRRAIKTTSVIPAMDDGDDLVSRTARTTPIPLADHLQHVTKTLGESLIRLPLPSFTEALHTAANLHDWGKADERFQAMLINGDLNDAWAQPTLWGKSGNMPSTAALRRSARRRSGLPSDFRHEMLSVQLAELTVDQFPADAAHRDLALHLIAAHHGFARPFAPVVLDDDPPEVSLDRLQVEARITAGQRKLRPPHRLDSGIADRFWTLTRRFGWWGLAYLEAVLRLADQRASQREDEQGDDQTTAEPQHAEAMP